MGISWAPPHSLILPRSSCWLQGPVQSAEYSTVCPPVPTPTPTARLPNHGFVILKTETLPPQATSLLRPDGPCCPPAGDLLCRRANDRWEFSILHTKFSEFGCAYSLLLDHHSKVHLHLPEIGPQCGRHHPDTLRPGSGVPLSS